MMESGLMDGLTQAESAMRETKEYSLNYMGYQYYYRITSHPDAVLPPVFFVSGAFQDMDAWHRFEKHFSQYSMTVVADLPGFGKADLLPACHGLDFYAAAVKQILDHAGIGKTYMISASYGSPIAYTVARQYPEKVDRLVLGGIMKEIPDNVRPRIERSLQLIENHDLDGFAEVAVESLCAISIPNRPFKQRCSERMLRRQLRQLSSDDLDRYLRNTRRLLQHEPLDLNSYPTVPTLVFTGEHDPFTLPAYCREIARAIPGAGFLTVDGGDHLCHLQYFETVIKILENFGFQLPVDNIPGTRYYPV